MWDVMGYQISCDDVRALQILLQSTFQALPFDLSAGHEARLEAYDLWMKSSW
jgi:hypothetical protein